MSPPRTRRTDRSAPTEPEETIVTVLDAPEELSSDPGLLRPLPSLTNRVPALRPLSPVPTYIGIAIAAAGFVLILIAWGKVAGLTNVALQMPYLVSGGLIGLGLVMVGVTTVNVAAKRRDAVLREQQTALLADALRELSNALDPEQHR
ncbi:MAG: hypothetical protein JWN31_860 [Frankiales bacterium]|nr:hypothetical protein [Frankiales bacterium]